MSETQPKYRVAIIGGGPAGNGVMIAADRKHAIPLLLHDGVVMIDGGNRQSFGQGGLNADIRSNTEAISFTAGIRSRGWYGGILTAKSGRQAEALGEKHVNLARVAAPILRDIGITTGKLLEDAPQGAVVLNTQIDRVVQEPSDHGASYTVIGRDGERFTARNIVLATGAQEKPMDLGRNSDKLLLSSQMFTDEGLELVWDRLRPSDHRRVAIIGGSHAGFSAAHRLLTTFGLGDSFNDETISILLRENPQLFFPSSAAARRAGYQTQRGDACQKTGSINRIRGLRGDAQALYRAIEAGDESRVKLHKINAVSDASEILDQADLIIQATGHTVREIPIVNANGRKIGPERDNGNVVIDDQMRVYGTDEEPLEGVYGIGHGYGMRPSVKFGGEPNATHGTLTGVNLYHGPFGEEIVNNIIASRN